MRNVHGIIIEHLWNPVLDRLRRTNNVPAIKTSPAAARAFMARERGYIWLLALSFREDDRNLPLDLPVSQKFQV